MTATIRPGGPADVPAVLALLDGAVAWLVAHGRGEQWGTEPASAHPRRQRTVKQWAGDGGLHLAEVAGRPVGALAVGAAPAYAPPATGPELYICLLVTDRAHAGRGIGARLLEHAAHLARTRGVDLLRVDCYDGPDRGLVGYYERQGFVATGPFTVPLPDGGRWPGRLLRRRLPPPDGRPAAPSPPSDHQHGGIDARRRLERGAR